MLAGAVVALDFVFLVSKILQKKVCHCTRTYLAYFATQRITTGSRRVQPTQRPNNSYYEYQVQCITIHLLCQQNAFSLYTNIVISTPSTTSTRKNPPAASGRDVTQVGIFARFVIAVSHPTPLNPPETSLSSAGLGFLGRHLHPHPCQRSERGTGRSAIDSDRD